MTPPDKIRVATAQYPLDAVSSLDTWRAKIARWVADAARGGANLLVFPEYGAIEAASSLGPAATLDLASTLTVAADMQDVLATVWSGLAKAHGVHILAPSGPERRGNAFVNAARLYAPNGQAGVQEKLILTPFERTWGMGPGRGLTVFATRIGLIAVAICYDSEFPLLVRAQVDAGARLLLIPSCTEHRSGYQRIRIAAAARSLENQIATVISPLVGDATWSPIVDHNSGSAAVLVPPDAQLSMSGVLAQGRFNEPGWVTADIDFAALARLGREGEMRNAADWAYQPGAAPLGRHVTVQDMT